MDSVNNNDEPGSVKTVSDKNSPGNQTAPQEMTATSENGVSSGRKSAGKADRQEPEWASGLKQLYNSVVDEPIPDMFTDLLAKLDDGSK